MTPPVSSVFWLLFVDTVEHVLSFVNQALVAIAGLGQVYGTI